jgi:hypothetical protein
VIAFRLARGESGGDGSHSRESAGCSNHVRADRGDRW